MAEQNEKLAVLCRALIVVAIATSHAALGDEASPATIWDGVYTTEQAGRGEAVYPAPCGKCHGFKLDGAPDDPDMESTPPIGGPKFLRDWQGRSLAALYEYTKVTMPSNNPGFLSDQEFVDLIAYTLAVTGAPAGDQELQADPAALAGIVITQSPR